MSAGACKIYILLMEACPQPKNVSIIQSENSRFSMLRAHYQEHAPSFIQQVPAKIREECQGWGDGPLESHPCDCRGAVHALVWSIVEGKMGVRGAPKHRKKASPRSKPTLLRRRVYSPGRVHEVSASPGHPLLSREVDRHDAHACCPTIWNQHARSGSWLCRHA
jgi:hypothetical protein